MKNIERWALRLGMDEKKSKSKEDFWAMCPCHRDDYPVLHVWVNPNDAICMKCFVCGARGGDVCRKFGAPMMDLINIDEETEDMETILDKTARACGFEDDAKEGKSNECT